VLFKKINHTYIIAGLLTIYICTQVYCIHQLTANYDETNFLNYGVSLLKLQRKKDIVKYESKLPVTALNALPRAVEQVFHPGLKKPDSTDDITAGRYVSLFAAVILSLVIFHWANLLYGRKPAFFSFIIFLLCPNFLAHGIFVSPDIFACLFMLLSLFFLWKFNQEKNIKYFFYASIVTGFAEISKFSMIHLFILFPLIQLLIYFIHKKNNPGLKINIRLTGILILIFIGSNWFIISASHLFYQLFLPLNSYHFISPAFQKIQSALHAVGNYIPVPLPSSYISSMDAVMYFDHLGGGMPGSLNGPSYILGKSSVHGFWYYYFVALFYKLPVPVLLLLVYAFITYFKKISWKKFTEKEIYLLVPSLYFLIYMNFFYSTQVGIRHILIILPLLYIFTGVFFSQLKSGVEKYVSYALVTWQCISVLLYFPHFLPYTNEFILNKKMAYKKIADTNLCYGEGKKYLSEYLSENPDAKYLPDKIEQGKIVMELGEMLNLNIKTMGKYDWVRTFTPVDHIHSQYLVFQISEAAADSLQKIKK
jgi:dolichyl-phosphate-mannose-protein mannosyltransferase